MKTIYYSKMNATPDSVIQKELNCLNNIRSNENIHVTMHIGGQYKEEKLSNADIIVVTSFNKQRKGMGVGKEVETALLLNKPCFMFYSIDNGTKTVIVKKIISTVFDQKGDIYLNRYILTLGEDMIPLNQIICFSQDDISSTYDSSGDMDDLC